MKLEAERCIDSSDLTRICEAQFGQVRVHSATESGGFSPDFQPQISSLAAVADLPSHSDAVTVAAGFRHPLF